MPFTELSLMESCDKSERNLKRILPLQRSVAHLSKHNNPPLTVCTEVTTTIYTLLQLTRGLDQTLTGSEKVKRKKCLFTLVAIPPT